MAQKRSALAMLQRPFPRFVGDLTKIFLSERNTRVRRQPPTGPRVVGLDRRFFVVPIFPTRFPTELLTTGWEMTH
jgi:hypothetical protein